MQCFQCELDRVHRCGRDATNFVDEIGRRQAHRFVGTPPVCEMTKGRAACHRWNATLRFETDCADRTRFNAGAEFQDVAANGILDANPRIGVLQIASVAGTIKVFYESGGIHESIVSSVSSVQEFLVLKSPIQG